MAICDGWGCKPSARAPRSSSTPDDFTGSGGLGYGRGGGWNERTRLAGDAQFPFRFRVIRLELFVSDGPIGKASARHASQPAGFVEDAREKGAEVPRERAGC